MGIQLNKKAQVWAVSNLFKNYESRLSIDSRLDSGKLS